MNRLALDTTGPACSVALRRPGCDDVVVTEEIGRGHAERLAPMAQALLVETGLHPSSLDEIVVATGPGSFAGARVGVAFGRGLALASGATAYGLTTLDAWAIEAGLGSGAALVCIHDARRGEAIWRLWRDGAPVTGLVHGSAGEAADRIRAALGEEQIDVAGSGARFLDAEGFTQTGIGAVSVRAMLDAPASLLTPPSPVYARAPDAKLPGGLDP